jgi:hypothetical protein
MKRFSGYIPDILYQKVQELAERDDRSFNQTVEHLLELAIKERTRKRKKNDQEVHSSNNPANPR